MAFAQSPEHFIGILAHRRHTLLNLSVGNQVALENPGEDLYGRFEFLRDDIVSTDLIQWLHLRQITGADNDMQTGMELARQSSDAATGGSVGDGDHHNSGFGYLEVLQHLGAGGITKDDVRAAFALGGNGVGIGFNHGIGNVVSLQNFGEILTVETVTDDHHMIRQANLLPALHECPSPPHQSAGKDAADAWRYHRPELEGQRG